MSQSGKFLLGSVIERKSKGPSVPPRSINPSVHGFPVVQHRSKSAFARSREEARKPISISQEMRPQAPPVIVSDSQVSGDAEPKEPNTDDWRAQMSAENEKRVAGMTAEEREAEKREILERFGVGIGDVLKRARLAREKNAAKDVWPGHKHKPPPPPSEVDSEAFNKLVEVPISEEEPAPSRPSGRGYSPPPALSRPHSRPSSRLDRKLRFAELGPKDVYVYESAPPSPKRQPLALPPPTDDGTAVSLGKWHGKLAPLEMPAPQPLPPPSQHVVSGSLPADSSDSKHEEPEEGTSEYIRRRYFPDAPPHDPNLAWMQGNPLPDSTDRASTSLRFDLNGNVIPLAVATQLPTHLGLHHHAEGSTAGYTLDDVFLLSRSTVPAQRATMLGVLASIALNLGKAVKGRYAGLEKLLPTAEDVRKRIMSAGVEAMNEKGSVGARAIEVAWGSIVGWDEDVMLAEGVELQTDSDTAISSLKLDFFLPQITSALMQGDLLPESSKQLLTILHRLAQQSNKIAETIVQAPNLLQTILHTFLLLSTPNDQNGRLPEPAALQLLITLASGSRSSAEVLSELRSSSEPKESSKPKWLRDLMDTDEALQPSELQKPANSLLRFITILPPSSPYPINLATSLLTLSLQLYRVLASYGLCSSIAKSTVEAFSQLSTYIVSPACDSQALKIAWLDLQSAWTVCAIDPHKTSPPHDFLWSQISGWLWKDEVAQIAQQLGDQEETWKLWGAVWRAEAQWLEGCRINCVKGGEAERSEYLARVRVDFSDGTRGIVVLGVLNALREGLEADDVDLERLAFYTSLLSAAIRIWLACLPPHLERPPSSPPFELPFPAISVICAKIVTHTLWDNFHSSGSSSLNQVYTRHLSGLLASYLTLSKSLPGIPEDLWLAQALAIIPRFMPGDEDTISRIIEQLLSLINLDWVNRRNVTSPMIIWDRGGLGILGPFFSHTTQPNKDDRIAPLRITPESIATSTTLRLPMASRRAKFGLPLNSDWTLTPINHLLRSADSEVFKNLPVGWDSSEVEITRATLFFSNICRDALTRFSLTQFSLTREEAVFGCMRVFMLEHGQPDDDSSVEVFRDPVVQRLMAFALEPYSYENAAAQGSRTACDLEKVATRFLGDSTPFFQFYTDFVGLYDAISFSETTFAKLLLPPTSMRYANDYRKHFWDDFNHIVKTIRTPCQQVLSSDLREYLDPIESDPQMIGAFLRVLLKEPLEGFVRLVAIHHIASSIWPDLRGDVSSEARAEKLVKAVAAQGSVDVVREITTYRQTASGAIWTPPVCFEFVNDVAEARMTWIRGLGDAMVVSRLEGLLM
ncbi:hypothetical protein NP233_g2738 [Leucocoprinus birnbaumii]|uniref:RNA polymerase II-associated protein 1 C-terminal domain-containing protein n=1 Tax=Leucocoprinus birnbaumii TaxID=56174 RepID=A0AAD5VXR5_9AGAR|nr:hypothetical protein NP233_g2738 [Leucocoprinus birnbaumii]